MAVVSRVPALGSVVLAVAMTAVTMATTDDEQQRAASPASPRQVQRPNLLWIIADDFGYNDIGYHNADNDLGQHQNGIILRKKARKLKPKWLRTHLSCQRDQNGAGGRSYAKTVEGNDACGPSCAKANKGMTPKDQPS